jgi:hypothetical protein
MIPSGVEVYVASTPVDFRKGPVSLMALVRDGGVDPFNGALYVFRSKRADRVKIVWWDGGGICLFAKTLEKEQFLLGADRAGSCAAELCSVACPCRRDGLEKGSTDNGAASAIGWLERGCDILNRGIWNASKIDGDHVAIMFWYRR